MSTWTLYFDGLCEPKNPGGRMAWGWVVQREGVADTGGCGSEAPGITNTNNVAEFCALGFGLREVQTLTNLAGAGPERLIVRGDSQLVVYTVGGKWQCRKPHLVALRDRCLSLLNDIGVEYAIEWVPREQNHVADEWSRRGYTNAEGKSPPERRRAG